MSLLDGFKPFNFNEGVPYVSVTSNGITFNRSVVIKLEYPENVVFLIDENKPQIAIQCCGASTPNSTQFFKPKKSSVISVRWNGRDLLKTLQGITGWDLSKNGYRVEGTLLKDERAMLFDLTCAEELK